MSYIGAEPQIGNYQICDAISVVNGQAAYTMQVSSTNVVPESANHMIVSLNGVIQKPGSSFTVSSSTITFASNLATGDSIDFIILLGNVLDLGVPSDSTVTTAKLGADAVTGAKIADDAINSEHYTDGSIDTAHIADAQVTTAKIAADAITAAKIADDAISEEHLDATVITGMTELAAEPADTDEFLISDAGTLKRIDYSHIKGGGITNAQQWRITANMTGMDNGDHITNNWEEADTYGYARIGDAMSNSSGIFTFPTTGIWLITHNVTFLDATEQSHLSCIITTTTDNGTYNSISISKTSLKLINSANTNAAASAQTIFDVTNTSTHKIRFAIGCQNNNIEVVGSTNANYTSATFIRLGDT